MTALGKPHSDPLSLELRSHHHHLHLQLQPRLHHDYDLHHHNTTKQSRATERAIRGGAASVPVIGTGRLARLASGDLQTSMRDCPGALDALVVRRADLTSSNKSIKREGRFEAAYYQV